MSLDAEKNLAPQYHQRSVPSSIMEDNRADNKLGDGDGPSDDSPAGQLAAMTTEEYLAMEKKLLWKIDKKIIPWITLLYLMSFLDRVNVGAAKLVGLVPDLHLSSLQYSNISMIFFVSYVFFEIPCNLVLKKFRPSRFIPITMIFWALFQIFMGLVTNYGQLLALRFCLGIFESGLFPGLNFFLTGWYRRDEINKRIAIFFGGAVMAGAFGGVFGFALSKMAGVGGKGGWAWIFIWEGVLTLIIAIASFWMVHDWPDRARFLTPLEREMVLSRLRADQGLAQEGKLTWRLVGNTFKDWRVWAVMLMYTGGAEPLYSGSLFSPTIIAALGKFTIPQSLLLSAPPSILSCFTMITTAYFSDRIKRRGFFLMFWAVICVIGYSILISVPITKPGVLYFALFLTVPSTGPLIATSIAWSANTFGNHYKRAIAMGFMFTIGNSTGIVASQVYRNKDAPRYILGHACALGFGALCFFGALTLYFGLKRENARRQAKFGSPPARDEVHEIDSEAYKRRWGLEGMTRDQIIELGDEHPAYRYLL